MNRLSAIFLVLVYILSYSGLLYSKVNVRGYYRSNGTYVQPHHRSDPDGNSYNNWSSKGNINPYTGKSGTKPPGYNENEQKPNNPKSDTWN